MISINRLYAKGHKLLRKRYSFFDGLYQLERLWDDLYGKFSRGSSRIAINMQGCIVKIGDHQPGRLKIQHFPVLYGQLVVFV